MLLIKTYLGKSRIHGIGVYSNEDVKKGSLIWVLEPSLDLEISNSDLFFIRQSHVRDTIIHYSHYCEKTNMNILCFDNARFFNKSTDPNCGGDVYNKSFALRDICIGDELTEMYKNILEYEVI